METQGHLTTNPGLRAHSVDPDNNLMKRYVIAYHPPGGIGWIWERSFDTIREAYEAACVGTMTDKPIQIIDSKTDEVLYEDIA